MSKEIDKLIEQVLKEDIGISDLKSMTGGLYGKTSIKKKFNYPSVKNHRKVKKVDALADLDGTATSISPKDIEDGLGSPEHKGYADAWLDGIVQGPSTQKKSFQLKNSTFRIPKITAKKYYKCTY